MANRTFLVAFFMGLIIVSSTYMAGAKEVPIISYALDSNGQVQLEVNSTPQHYYILKIRHHVDSVFGLATSMTLGKSNKTVISEQLGFYPLAHYQVLEYLIASPFDTDEDGIDDITEYQNYPLQCPVNAGKSINGNDGSLVIDTFSTFKKLAIKKDVIKWSEFLNGKEYVKYIIVDLYTAPKIYFINSSLYNLHEDFALEIGIDHLGDHVKKGQIIYHPESISNGGNPGTFVFNYSNGRPQEFDVVQKTHELLAANMPLLKNNLSYFITVNNEDKYNQDSSIYQNSRVSVLFESDIYYGLDYWGLNQTEGFGFFRHMNLEETPGPKDLVLYESLPNSLPRVGGIMTSAIQTPLSHVNLRAIQNNVPNAFIRNPLNIDSISDLLGDYVYFKVEQENYFIRKASLQEVNEWFEDLRPNGEQIPPINLTYTKILPLSEIGFSMYDGFGAKCTNIATMTTFGFPDKTIPDGFGVPFYFYQEFMKYNNFFEEIKAIINNPDFKSDRNVRKDILKKFRKKIKDAKMPKWMLDELAVMQSSFPEGTSIRCRSSSNNEDLAGFSGAGLFTSKTQHPDEVHISKSMKQVYASLWNLRAFEERDFYKINHFASSMGVLCHPNYSNEKANGVGVSTDPIYRTENTFYLNTQVGEDLITNPDTNSIPEEILLDKETGYIVIEHSNLLPSDTTIMSDEHLEQMRDYFVKIHNEFERLYNAVNNSSFAVDIEYKITSDDQLIIKQARPWVSYIPQKDSATLSAALDFNLFPNPSNDYIYMDCDCCNLSKITITSIAGQQLYEKTIPNADNSNVKISLQNLSPGIYIISGFDTNDGVGVSKRFIKL
ncbi:MAG: hypothetical protein ACI9JN_002534 [Bacteroidia bacterium]|jgi:hypothetical protein